MTSPDRTDLPPHRPARRGMVSRCTLLLLPLLLLAAETTPRRNILFIAADDLGPYLGCYGDPHARTPCIDALAARGMVFRRSYVQQAVCAPSRNALLTGIRPESMGIYDLATFFRDRAPDVVTWPQAFRQAGWECQSLGKIEHMGHGNHPDPQSWSVPTWHPPRGYDAKRPGVTDPARNNPPKMGHSWSVVSDDPSKLADAAIAAKAVQRLDQLKDRPFLLAIGFIRPHLPFVAPKQCYDLYDPATLPVFPVDAGLAHGAPAFSANGNSELRSYRDIDDTRALTEAEARALVHGYYAAVSWVDQQVGVVLDELDRLGLRDSTTVVLWGDHGFHLGDHGLWCKHTNLETATRNPLIIAGPGVATGVSDALVETIDVFPTLCRLAGVPVPPTAQGTDLQPLLTNPAARVHEAVYHCYPRKAADGTPLLGQAVRDERFRYIEWQPMAGGPAVARELYDYQTDPAETASLHDAPEHAATVQRLAALLAARGPHTPALSK